MYQSLFIHPPTEVHLVYFQILVNMNKDSIDIYMCEHKFSAPLGKCQELQCLDHMIGMFCFVRNSKVPVPFRISTNSE